MAGLVGGETCVVLGSRSGEEWLKNQTFQTNIYQLQGLDKEARSVLAEKILERHVAAHQIPSIRQDADFIRLMQVLAGYPLAMEVVLANLKQQLPSEILAGLQPGERFVAQSGRPLKDGETVGLSILSETQAGGQN